MFKTLSGIAFAFALALSIATFAFPNVAQADDGALGDGDYTVTVSTAFAKLGVQSSATLSVSGGVGTLTITSYPALDGEGSPRYDKIAKGVRSSAPADPNDPSINWITGTPIYGASDGSDQGYWNGSGYVIGYRYQIPVSQSEIENGVSYIARYTDHYISSSGSADNAGQYSGTQSLTFAISNITPVNPSDPDDPDPDDPDPDDPDPDDPDPDDPDPDNPDPDDPEPFKVDEVKAMIEQLPTDAYAITEQHIEAIEAAEEAFNALTEEEQSILDTEIASSSQPFGRILETAVWTVTSFTSIDNSTSLANGTYTNKAVIASDLGKSTSERQRGWTLLSITAKDGKATAKIKWDGYATLDTLRIGNEFYSNIATDGTSVFEIPVDLNSDMYFAVKTRGATDTTDAIAYHVVITMDESSAQPDKEKQESTDPVKDNTEKAAESAKSAKKAASTSGRSGLGSSLKKPSSAKSARGGKGGMQKASYSPGSDGFVTASTTGASSQDDSIETAITLIAIIAGAALIGYIAFTARFKKLEKR